MLMKRGYFRTYKENSMDCRNALELRWVIEAVVAIVLFGILANCDYFSEDFVPNAYAFDGKHPEFVIDNKQMTGVYGNYDVDVRLVYYVISEKVTPSPLDRISEDTQRVGWNIESKNNSEIVFVRHFSKGEESPERADMLMFDSTEVARVNHIEDKNIIVIGYLQADGTGEIKWANKHFWWRYNELIDQLSTEGEDVEK